MKGTRKGSNVWHGGILGKLWGSWGVGAEIGHWLAYYLRCLDFLRNNGDQYINVKSRLVSIMQGWWAQDSVCLVDRLEWFLHKAVTLSLVSSLCLLIALVHQEDVCLLRSAQWVNASERMNRCLWLYAMDKPVVQMYQKYCWLCHLPSINLEDGPEDVGPWGG